jgi:serine/threonine protein phosphatase PrpC
VGRRSPQKRRTVSASTALDAGRGHRRRSSARSIQPTPQPSGSRPPASGNPPHPQRRQQTNPPPSRKRKPGGPAECDGGDRPSKHGEGNTGRQRSDATTTNAKCGDKRNAKRTPAEKNNNNNNNNNNNKDEGKNRDKKKRKSRSRKEDKRGSSAPACGSRRTRTGDVSTGDARGRRSCRFATLGPLSDHGNKYHQAVSPLTPANVAPLAGAASRGVRMEDSATVVTDLGPLNEGVVLVVVADGHGSVAAYGDGTDRDTSRYLGGAECARLATEVLAGHVTEETKRVRIEGMPREAIAGILQEGFDRAQRACAEETRRGALPRRRGSVGGGGTREDERQRRKQRDDERQRRDQLHASRIDGYHFADLADAREAAMRRGGRAEWEARRRRWLVAEKVLVQHPSGQEVVAYMSGDPDATRPSSIAEYGTTLTAALFLPGSAEVYVAHAGDSDAYAFRDDSSGFGGSMRVRVPMRLTGDHTVRNPQEVARMKQHGMEVNQQYFVLPGVASLMPSRSLGHTLLSKHGVTHEPAVSVTKLRRGDVVVVASDGLWASYGRCVCNRERRGRGAVGGSGGRTRRGAGSGAFPQSALGNLQGVAAMRDEDVSALRVAELMADRDGRGDVMSAAAIAMQEISVLVPFRDNLVLVAVQVV